MFPYLENSVISKRNTFRRTVGFNLYLVKCNLKIRPHRKSTIRIRVSFGHVARLFHSFTLIRRSFYHVLNGRYKRFAEQILQRVGYNYGSCRLRALRMEAASFFHSLTPISNPSIHSDFIRTLRITSCRSEKRYSIQPAPALLCFDKTSAYSGCH